jgi:hypothetical protein
MDKKFNQLYQEKLRQHAMHPENFKKNQSSSVSLSGMM